MGRMGGIGGDTIKLIFTYYYRKFINYDKNKSRNKFLEMECGNLEVEHELHFPKVWSGFLHMIDSEFQRLARETSPTHKCFSSLCLQHFHHGASAKTNAMAKPGFKGWTCRLYLLMGGTPKSYCKEEWKQDLRTYCGYFANNSILPAIYHTIFFHVPLFLISVSLILSSCLSFSFPLFFHLLLGIPLQN